MRDVFEVTPPHAEGVGLCAGATTWEVVFKIVLPYTKAGVIGGIMLGLGRALGETMAVTFVIGNINQLDSLSVVPGGQQHHICFGKRVCRSE
jgi:phosphate transport system permease protein